MDWFLYDNGLRRERVKVSNKGKWARWAISFGCLYSYFEQVLESSLGIVSQFFYLTLTEFKRINNFYSPKIIRKPEPNWSLLIRVNFLSVFISTFIISFLTPSGYFPAQI